MRARRAVSAPPFASDARLALLAWYGPREHAYPWRSSNPDPYRVLVSEVMLQQTQAARVVSAYLSFIRRFPNIRALAAAERGDVLRAWNGLGYNRRAVALSEAARAVVRDSGGQVPRDPEALLRLPGVGPYTAAAVASIAYRHPVPALDTNVMRVVGRFALGADPMEVSMPALREAAERLLERGDPGRWNQAMMDLGREACRSVPRCNECPLSGSCRYVRTGRKDGKPFRRQAPYPGSSRQLRGAVVRNLSAHGLTLGALVAQTGQPLERVTSVVAALASEGLLRAGRGALAGNARGRVWLGERRSP